MRSSKFNERSVCRTSAGTKKILAFLGVLTVATALDGCAVFPQSSNPAVDKAITANVEMRFGQNAELEVPSQLNVQTINRVVYLSGLVATGLQRRDAELVANQVQGVEKVVNLIGVTR